MLAALAIALAVYCYFTGADNALPLRTVPHLQAMPLTLDRVAVGATQVPVQVSGFVVSLTHDVAGPFTQPTIAAVFVCALALMLAGWVAVVSMLRRTAFVASMVPVIFLLLSLNTEELGIFNTRGRASFYLLLAVVVGGGFALHAFADTLALRWRHAIMGVLMTGAGAALVAGSQLPASETALLVAAHATHAGAILVAAVVLWLSVENIRALLWFNTQAERPQSRFGLLPFVAASLLYLGILLLYVWNGGNVQLGAGMHFEPLALLLPAAAIGWLGLPQRAPSYAFWVPYARGMAQLYPLVLMAAAAALAYAFATDNTPFVVMARDFTAQALMLVGGLFLMYVLVNFSPLIRQRLRVYKVVFEPRHLPFYTVYIIALAALGVLQSNNGLVWPDQVQAAQFNNLGDLTRLQSEGEPDNLALAVLAERYYAESGDVLYRSNLHAQMGRAALYRFRGQRQNEVNSLNRALQRGPIEKASVRLAAMYSDPQDLFDGLDILRKGLKGAPNSVVLTSDLAQLFTRTSVNDSVAYYMDRAEQLAPKSYVSRTNQLAFLLQQGLLPAARQVATTSSPKEGDAALASNLTLLELQLATANKAKSADGSPGSDADTFAKFQALDNATFAQLYHAALTQVQRRQAILLPTMARLGNEPRNEAYYEQLVFLQALTRHAVGQEMAARQQLAPLLAGNSATARYYQNLLGIWQLQQGQYATAADQLDRAGITDSVTRKSIREMAQRSAKIPASQPAPVGTAWLAQARQAEQQNNAAAAAKSYQRIIREAPFNESAILATADFYARRKDYTAAYEALHAGLEENPKSARVLQAYALSAAAAGLNEYAADALARLRLQLPAAEYATFVAAYSARRAAQAAAAASFSAAPSPTLLP